MKKASPSSDGMRIDSPAWRLLLTEGAACFGLQLDEAQIDMFQAYAQELLAWNRRINLTTITSPADVAIKHFVDSLAGAGELKAGWRVVDLGSGGGFPGIPLSIIRPDLSITLVDAVRKKTSFQKQTCRRLGLTHVSAVHARIEDLSRSPSHIGRYDAAVTRALTELPRLQELSLPLMTTEGVIIAYRGRVDDTHDVDSSSVDKEFDRGWQVSTRSYRLPHLAAYRSITRCERLPA